MVAARIGAALLITHLAQRFIYELRLDFSGRIVAAPLSHLQTLGAPQVLSRGQRVFFGDDLHIAQPVRDMECRITGSGVMLG